MKRSLGPDWSAEGTAAGRELAERWIRHASATGSDAGTPFGGGSAEVAEVRARHEADLMAYPHVVAVADGICQKGDDAGKACIVVYVDTKLPPEQLDAASRLPERIDGVRIDVVEAGSIGILPTE